ncbi:hypothetical protein FQA39_LY12897 [Lamprigera yunnana]|nr:hypothetical protein FQA39_LY12897 [Lamprigera yunnana]
MGQNQQEIELDIIEPVKPKQIKFELPVGEKVYELDEVQFIKSGKSIDLKELDKLARVKAERIEDYFDDNNDTFILKSSYRLNNQKIREITFKGMIITNQNKIATSLHNSQETRLLNFFDINKGQYRIVDAPGYGYARISDAMKIQFGEMMEEFMTTRKNLKAVCMLVDLRHKPTKDDVEIYLDSQKDMFLNALVLANDSVTENGSRIGDPTELALVDFAELMGVDEQDERDENERIDEIPFDSERKLMTQLIKSMSYLKSITCFRFCLFLSTQDDGDHEEDLIFIGAVGMIDPVRDEAIKLLSMPHDAGIRVVMITGDQSNYCSSHCKRN